MPGGVPGRVTMSVLLKNSVRYAIFSFQRERPMPASIRRGRIRACMPHASSRPASVFVFPPCFKLFNSYLYITSTSTKQSIHQ